jgi:hypothetical protein
MSSNPTIGPGALPNRKEAASSSFSAAEFAAVAASAAAAVLCLPRQHLPIVELVLASAAGARSPLSRGLGMRIIAALARQLGARITQHGGVDGTEFALLLPLERRSES